MKKNVELETNKSKQVQKKYKQNDNMVRIIETCLFWLVFGFFIATIVSISVTLMINGTWRNNGIAPKTINENIGDLALCGLGLLLLVIPSIITKKFHVKIPHVIYILYLIFIYLSIYLGHAESLYKKIKYFDSFVHMFSGILLGFFSMTLLKFGNKSNNKISPWLILVFAVSFTVMIGVLWEIYEFVWDAMNKGNMQRTSDVKTSEVYVGRVAIKDTMIDLILDVLGGLIAGIMGFCAVKKDQSNFSQLTLALEKRKTSKKEVVK